jgi:hypothetical protein
MNQLYPLCFEKGEVNPAWLKDCARGAWRLRADRRASIRYLVALYRSRVVGIYRVTSVSEPLAEMWQKDQLKDFPIFPTRLRCFDRYRAQYPSFEAAMADLPPEEAQAFRAALLGPKGDTSALSQEAWETYQTRVYFTVDDAVPPELMRFMGVRLLKRDKHGRLRLLDEQNPVSYLFHESPSPQPTRTP